MYQLKCSHIQIKIILKGSFVSVTHFANCTIHCGLFLLLNCFLTLTLKKLVKILAKWCNKPSAKIRLPVKKTQTLFVYVFMFSISSVAVMGGRLSLRQTTCNDYSMIVFTLIKNTAKIVPNVIAIVWCMYFSSDGFLSSRSRFRSTCRARFCLLLFCLNNSTFSKCFIYLFFAQVRISEWQSTLRLTFVLIARSRNRLLGGATWKYF